MTKYKCKHIKYCPFRRTYGYCIKQIGEECQIVWEVHIEDEARNDSFVLLPHYCSYSIVEEPADIVIEVAKEYDAERT